MRLSYLSSIFSAILNKLDNNISMFRSTMLPLPRYHPLRAFCVQLLARANFVRYTLSEQQDDLEEATKSQSLLKATTVIIVSSE